MLLTPSQKAVSRVPLNARLYQRLENVMKLFYTTFERKMFIIVMPGFFGHFI